MLRLLSANKKTCFRSISGPANLGVFKLPPIKNEPMLNFAPGSKERELLKKELASLKSAKPIDIPCVVGDETIYTGLSGKQVMPSNHSHVVATFHEATKDVAEKAIRNSLAAKEVWENMPFEDRAAIFLKAADLLSTKYRYKMMAATILGQAKTAWQAEIDCIAEQADFWRFNVKFADTLYREQPAECSPYIWNRLEYRPLEGFVYAISPFNFTAIGSNLASSPVIMGNVSLWKPSSTSILANYLSYQIFREAGLPAGVINFLPGNGLEVSNAVFNNSAFSGLHFTGSSSTFQHLLDTINKNTSVYRNFPRVVGETGGKNFHFVHASADIDQVVYQTIRSAFEYSGQKCSACSRLYVPKSLWEGGVREKLIAEVGKVSSLVGQPDDLRNFTSSVIDDRSFAKITGYISRVRSGEIPGSSILVGGESDSSQGYFVKPTVVLCNDPLSATMVDEIFGPLLSVHVYADSEFESTLALCDRSTSYALTGSIFSRDRSALIVAHNALRNSAGNFYVNDKSTGAVVGQQPFGGARKSGTNDKAGHVVNLLKWTSLRTIKENFVELNSWGYPHMEREN